MTSARIHFWDMDHTVIANDCDVSWKEFLVARGHAGEAETMALATMFYDQYAGGVLDVPRYLDFQLAEFKGRSLERMRQLAADHFEHYVADKMYPEAMARIAALSADSTVQVCMITATNRIIAEPVAAAFGIGDLLATELAIMDDHFTGHIDGEYCVGAGKLSYIDHFCGRYGCDRHHAAYYGDSVMDIPILEAVGYPVVVNPGEVLRDYALANDWPMLTFSL